MSQEDGNFPLNRFEVHPASCRMVTAVSLQEGEKAEKA
jgi:hypothetical protein